MNTPPGPMPVAVARAAMLREPCPPDSESVPLSGAGGRVLAEDVRAPCARPGTAVSAMDGWALCAADIPAGPVAMPGAGEIRAGDLPGMRLPPGQAVRIFTGAPLPPGADCVIPQEDVDEAGDGMILVRKAGKAGAYVRPEGLDFRKGETLATGGTRITPSVLALLASAGLGRLAVFRQPSVAILSTGNELAEPGSIPAPGIVIASNGPGLAEVVRRGGGIAINAGIARDEPESLAAHILGAGDADLLLVCGGASVGTYDLVRPALLACGYSLDFAGIAMRPGKPAFFGRKAHRSVLGLPGNPVSTLVCAFLFLRPLLAALGGERPVPLPFGTTARLASPLPAVTDREEYLRAVWRLDPDGGLLVTPSASQDSSQLATLARSNCLIRRAPFAESASMGDFVTILPLEFP